MLPIICRRCGKHNETICEYDNHKCHPPLAQQMTLREHYAGLFAQGMITHGYSDAGGSDSYWPLNKIPEEAVDLADDLIAELQKEKS